MQGCRARRRLYFLKVRYHREPDRRVPLPLEDEEELDHHPRLSFRPNDALERLRNNIELGSISLSDEHDELGSEWLYEKNGDAGLDPPNKLLDGDVCIDGGLEPDVWGKRNVPPLALAPTPAAVEPVNAGRARV